eukprot:TRINITY_DN17238_c0_g1_i1.p1 TRINITY_DN17238_c0_g1~~TRINITY_DN17238_c0_g1_i1.p1  ORF type:complete len:952 (-),score=222.83 TRINITY_DN17238_c0_g1_i1:189-2702(-)
MQQITSLINENKRIAERQDKIKDIIHLFKKECTEKLTSQLLSADMKDRHLLKEGTCLSNSQKKMSLFVFSDCILCGHKDTERKEKEEPKLIPIFFVHLIDCRFQEIDDGDGVRFELVETRLQKGAASEHKHMFYPMQPPHPNDEEFWRQTLDKAFSLFWRDPGALLREHSQQVTKKALENLLTEQDWVKLHLIMNLQEYKYGDFLYKEGVDQDTLYLVARGTLGLYKNLPMASKTNTTSDSKKLMISTGQELMPLSTHNTGEFIGLSSFFSKHRPAEYTARVVSEEGCKLHLIGFSGLRRCLETDLDLADRFFRLCSYLLANSFVQNHLEQALRKRFKAPPPAPENKPAPAPAPEHSSHLQVSHFKMKVKGHVQCGKVEDEDWATALRSISPPARSSAMPEENNSLTNANLSSSEKREKYRGRSTSSKSLGDSLVPSKSKKGSRTDPQTQPQMHVPEVVAPTPVSAEEEKKIRERSPVRKSILVNLIPANVTTTTSPTSSPHRVVDESLQKQYAKHIAAMKLKEPLLKAFPATLLKSSSNSHHCDGTFLLFDGLVGFFSQLFGRKIRHKIPNDTLLDVSLDDHVLQIQRSRAEPFELKFKKSEDAHFALQQIKSRVTARIFIDSGRRHHKMERNTSLNLNVLNVPNASPRMTVSNVSPRLNNSELKLTEFDWEELRQYTTRTMFMKNEPILAQGDSSQRLYQLIEGSCRVEVLTNQENSITSHLAQLAKAAEAAQSAQTTLFLSSGDCVKVVGKVLELEMFGELSFVLGGVANASVVADEDAVDVVFFEREALDSLLRGNSRLSAGFYRYLCKLICNRHTKVSSSLIQRYAPLFSSN